MVSGKSDLHAFLNQLDPTLSYGETKAALVAEFERFYVTRLIEANYGNLTLAARIARMDRKYLNELMKKHHLEDVRKNAARSNANFRE